MNVGALAKGGRVNQVDCPKCDNAAMPLEHLTLKRLHDTKGRQRE